MYKNILTKVSVPKTLSNTFYSVIWWTLQFEPSLWADSKFYFNYKKMQ